MKERIRVWLWRWLGCEDTDICVGLRGVQLEALESRVKKLEQMHRSLAEHVNCLPEIMDEGEIKALIADENFTDEDDIEKKLNEMVDAAVDAAVDIDDKIEAWMSHSFDIDDYSDITSAVETALDDRNYISADDLRSCLRAL